ncbi:MAG: Flp pilus assembly complex ATPase component TadA [Planctomycetes bacterium]|nr:Flp pilus assembly complex ATPase component TadA [Planctomycetota bacterium]MCB9918434.1 Flp pilus assembly complex ATPase component TadA [Planctomycetota bacterium]
MINLESLVEQARNCGASDLHLEPDRPLTLRIDGRLSARGGALPCEALIDALRAIVHGNEWKHFVDRRSLDFATTLAGIRCRINAFHTIHGIGIAIRLLRRGVPSFEELNLHPSIAALAREQHGLIVISGPTGSGKSTTLAALVREIDKGEPRHVITLEHPVEYVHGSSRSLIRQRDVGRDTPSFQQGLMDAMREDPDVILVGELRDPETMRLTLDAAETGHLVLTTVHSQSTAEALSRIASAFPHDIQSLVCTQLADCLVAVVAQTLRYQEEEEIRVPECEILRASTPVRSMVRKADFFRLETVLQTGAVDGQWTRERYRRWLDERTGFHRAPNRGAHDETIFPRNPVRFDVEDDSEGHAPPRHPASQASEPDAPDDVIVIDPPAGTLSDILEELE